MARRTRKSWKKRMKSKASSRGGGGERVGVVCCLPLLLLLPNPLPRVLLRPTHTPTHLFARPFPGLSVCDPLAFYLSFVFYVFCFCFSVCCGCLSVVGVFLLWVSVCLSCVYFFCQVLPLIYCVWSVSSMIFLTSRIMRFNLNLYILLLPHLKFLSSIW